MSEKGAVIPGFMGSRLSWTTDQERNRRAFTLHTHDERQSQCAIDYKTNCKGNYEVEFLSGKEKMGFTVRDRDFLRNALEMVLRNEETVVGTISVTGTLARRVYSFGETGSISFSATTFNDNHREICCQIVGQTTQEGIIVVAELLHKIGTEEVIYNFSEIHNCDLNQMQLVNTFLTGISVLMVHDSNALWEFLERDSVEHRAMEILLI